MAKSEKTNPDHSDLFSPSPVGHPGLVQKKRPSIPNTWWTFTALPTALEQTPKKAAYQTCPSNHLTHECGPYS